MATFNVSLSSDDETTDYGISCVPACFGPLGARGAEGAEAGDAGEVDHLSWRTAPPYELLSHSQQSELKEAIIAKLKSLVGDHEDLPLLAEFVAVKLQQKRLPRELARELDEFEFLHGMGGRLVAWVWKQLEACAVPRRAVPRASSVNIAGAQGVRGVQDVGNAAIPAKAAPALPARRSSASDASSLAFRVAAMDVSGRAPPAGANRGGGSCSSRGRRRSRSRSRSRCSSAGWSDGAGAPAPSSRLSRALCAVLRHRAPEAGIQLTPEGFAPLRQVLRALRRCRSSPAEVRELVGASRRDDGTPRFELRESVAGTEGPLIRATRRHTIPGVYANGAQVPRSDRLSRALSAILRHTAPREGVALSPEGFAPLGKVLAALRLGPQCGEVEFVVRTSRHRDGAPRFELAEGAGGPWIRATRRHTVAGVGARGRAHRRAV